MCAGQTSSDSQGQSLHPGDMKKQIEQAMDNLTTVLNAAGLELRHVVRLNAYTTDVDAFLAAADVYISRLKEAGCRPAATLLGVQRLAFPELLVEIEATAAE